MFVFQPTFNTIKQVSNNIFAWKSKGIYNSELKPLHDLSPVIICLGHKIVLQFNSSVLPVTQNNCKNKFANVYIVYDLDNWPRYVFENFTVKIVKIAKNMNMCILFME